MFDLYITEVNNTKTHSNEFVKKVLSRYVNIDWHKVRINKNKYGKPYLRDFPNIHYNISHTKGAIVCAVSDNPVGVDIERVRPYKKQIIEYFFTQNEREYIFKDMENQDKRFTEIWTKKEAYVKWAGTGIEIPFNKFDVLYSEKKAPKLNSFFYLEYCITVCSEQSLLKSNETNNIFNIINIHM